MAEAARMEAAGRIAAAHMAADSAEEAHIRAERMWAGHLLQAVRHMPGRG